MFSIRDFIKRNIKNGVKNGTFTREYASILLIGYLGKGYISEDDMAELDEYFDSLEVVPEPIEEPTDDIITGEETVDEVNTEELTE